MVKKFLDEKGVTYEEIDLAANPDRVSELVEVSGQLGVPVIVIGSQVVIGFDRGSIESALAA